MRSNTMHSGRNIRTLLESRLVAPGLLGIGLLALGSLVVGAPYLETTLPGGLPLGNLLAAVGLCAIAASGAAIARRGVMRRIAFVALIATMAWLPVSIAMAGNLTLVFSGARGDTWIALSAGVAILTFGVFGLAVLQRLALIVCSCRARVSQGR